MVAYSGNDLTLIKERLKITDSSKDTYLGHLQTQADAKIDNALKRYTSVPLSVVPEIIKQIAIDLVCGIYSENQASGPTGTEAQPNIFSLRAQLDLERYIRETFLDSIVKGVTPVLDNT